MTNKRSAIFTEESWELKSVYPGLYEIFYLIMDCTHITLSKKARKKMRARGLTDHFGSSNTQMSGNKLEAFKDHSAQEFRKTIYVPTQLDTDPRDRLYKWVLSNSTTLRRFDNVSEAISRGGADKWATGF